MVACCQCGAYEYIHRDRSFHKFPKNKELRAKWLAAIGRKEIYASARLCSNHFDYDDFNNNEYNSRRTLLPGVVPHRNLEKKKKNTGRVNNSAVLVNSNAASFTNNIGSINNNSMAVNNVTVLVNNNPSSVNVHSEANDNDAELLINDAELIDNDLQVINAEFINSDAEIITYNAEVTSSDAEVINNQIALINNHAELIGSNDQFEETIVIIGPEPENLDCIDGNRSKVQKVKIDKCVGTEVDVSPQKRILKNIDISKIKRIKLELLNKSMFMMTRRNFTSDEAWYAFVLNQIIKRQRDKKLQAKSKRLKNKVLNLQNILEVLKHKNYVSKSGADKIQEIVPPEVQEMLQIMLSQRKSLKFSEELKSFATTLHYYSPAGYQYVRNTFLKCLPHVSTLGKPRQGPKNIEQSGCLQEN